MAQVVNFEPKDLLHDALQYGSACALCYLVPNDQHVTDFRLAYELGILQNCTLCQAALDRIVVVLANIPLLTQAMQAWRLEHPNQLMILRVYTIAPTSFLQPAEKMILPAAMGPMCVVGRGRSTGVHTILGTSSPMLATLHNECSFDGVPFSKHLESPRNGFYVYGVGSAQSTSEIVWQFTAGGLLAFTVAALCGPLVAGLAGFGVSLGALYIPAGTTLKYALSSAAARIGGWVAGYWTRQPNLIEGFRVPNQRSPRMIMATEIYGSTGNARYRIEDRIENRIQEIVESPA